MRRALLLPLAMVAMGGGIARADSQGDKAACFDAASQAQTLRDAHELVAAREAARRCASQGCPAQVQKDCAGWLDAIEQDLPTVILLAKDPAGNDLVDVTVTIDGQPLASKLTGDAIPVDPGAHTLRFETAGGAKLVLFARPAKGGEQGASLRAAPAVGSRSGGLTLAGSW